MAYEGKMDAELELALKYYQSSVGTVFAQNTGIYSLDQWELIVKYHGDILIPVQTVDAKVEILNESFASVVIAPDKIMDLLVFFEIEYMQLPQRMFYILQESYGKACITNVHSGAPYNLLGKEVLLGIIDSGITYTHPDFRNEDGTTRIAYLWDQTIEGKPPIDFSLGTEYTIEETMDLVPSLDERGHGTAVAGVAGGNGRASQGREVGVAPQADLIIVKVGTERDDYFPRTLEVMKALKYVIEKATELNKPIAVNIGFGMVQGGHDGRSLLEIFIDQMAVRWKCSIVVGTGNQGNEATHTEGVVEPDEEEKVQFIISPNQKFYAFSLWKSFIDTFEIKITSPTGEETDRVAAISNSALYVIGRTIVFINFSEPSTSFAAISVGAFNPFTNQVAAFSGRGFTRHMQVKPNLTGPGVGVLTADNQGGYRPASGTSVAAAFVTGGAALLMEWGLVKGNDPFLYGDRLKTALARNTRRLVTNINYPNDLWGYGAFCLENTLISLINR